MARRLRIEYPGAIYHVLNRGNYRRDLFVTVGEAQAFLGAVEEAAGYYRWHIHAYAVMRNHYHLAVETPEPNLTEGMHWLQTTFATRFNRLHGERGHLFQGRYQALLVEDSAALARLVNYIHLNPVRAGIVTAEQVAAFRWSSLGRLVRGIRFPGMVAADWLRALGYSDDHAGWTAYLEGLQELAASPGEQERAGFGEMSKGWAIGTTGWRQAVAKDHAHLALKVGLSAPEARALREARWADCLTRILTESGCTTEDLRREAKSAPWKITLARRVRRESGCSVVWLAAMLAMGSPNAVRGYLCREAARDDKMT